VRRWKHRPRAPMLSCGWPCFKYFGSMRKTGEGACRHNDVSDRASKRIKRPGSSPG
jgi:hypothetical protein